MAGITITVQDRGVLDALGELIRRGENLAPALRDVGEHLLNSTHDRFDAEVAPDGTPWAPLSPAYARRKKKNPDKILVLDGYLEDFPAASVDEHSVAIGTNRIYGATHQFGDERRHIPARPFLGLSDADRAEVLSIFGEYLTGHPA